MSVTLFLVLLCSIVSFTPSEAKSRNVRIAFFEGGDYLTNGLFRQAFREELEAILPDSITPTYAAADFFSSNWNRDSCRALAKQVSAPNRVDLIVAFGPWVVEELLAADCRLPILGVDQFDPARDGLLDRNGRPLASNLTLHVRPHKLEREVTATIELLKPKRLGILVFPSDRPDSVIEAARKIASAKQVTLVTPTGNVSSNSGTFAFFKAYQSVAPTCDAIYIGPTYGLSTALIKELYKAARDQKKPIVAADGRFSVERGALFAVASQTIYATARYQAWKAYQIIKGQLPADLPIEFPEETRLSLNQTTADLLSFKLPFDLLSSAEIITDPISSETARLGLHEAIQAALLQNPDYLAQLALIDSVVATTNRAVKNYLPSLTFDASLGWIDDNSIYNSGDRYSANRSRASLTIEQPIIDLMALKNGRVKKSENAISETDRALARIDLEFAVVTAFRAYAEAQENFDLAQSNRLVTDRALEIARVRSVFENAHESEMLSLRFAANAADVEITLARAEEQIARVLLNALLGQPLDRAPVLDTIGTAPSELLNGFQLYRKAVANEDDLKVVEEKLLKLGTRHAPSIKQASERVSGSKSRLGVSKYSALPTLTFRGEVAAFDSLRSFDAFNPKKSGWNAELKLNFPLFNASKNAPAKRSIIASLDRAEYLADAARIHLASDISASLQTLESYVASFGLTNEMSQLAVSNVQASMTEFDKGTIHVSEILDVISSLNQARMAQLALRYDFFATVAKLRHMLGQSPSGSIGELLSKQY